MLFSQLWQRWDLFQLPLTQITAVFNFTKVVFMMNKIAAVQILIMVC